MPSKLEYIIRNLFWFSNRPFVYLFMKRAFNFVTTADSDRVPDPPYVMVSNHSNFFDPWIVGYQARHALFIMMNDDGFRGSKFQQTYLHAIGAFAKKKGAHDYRAMKYTLGLLKSGFPVLIFPEGQTSWDGETQPIYSGIEKIIKRGKCPLVMMHLHGNFLSKPWWARRRRRGKIVVQIKSLDAARLASMGNEELLGTIRSYIYNNDIKNPANREVAFSGTGLAEGLERFVWICRQCEAEDALVMSGNTITCTACSATWEINAYCDLKPRMPNIAPAGDLHDWVAWHKQQVKERLAEAMGDAIITDSHDVVLQTEEGRGNGFIDRRAGTLVLTPKEIRFIPDDSSATLMEWELEKIEDYVIQAKDIFEFRVGKQYFRFVFDGHSPMKWIFYMRYMKEFDEVEQRGFY
jgi:1-acyl-sn-glycerol-3-phosphate acyltransferase